MKLRGMWIAVAILSAASPALADERTQRADELFGEGKVLLATDLAGACAKFEASLALNPQAIGTLLNVALCDEKLGRYASAVVRFSEARDRAREQGRDAELRAAEEHLAALVDKVPHVTLRFGAVTLPGTKIVIDEQLVPLTALEKRPLDPGEHTLVVSAPRHLPYEATFTVVAGETTEVAIPALERSVTVRSSRPTIGKITAAAGVAALGTSLGIGLVANRRYDAGTASCERSDGVWVCDSTGYATTRSARTLATVGTVVGAVGVVAIGVGGYLWLGAPRETAPRRVSVVPHVGGGQAGFLAVGSF